ncbi:hypothetical protein FZEAL_5314 [Fusarium zealandicum]|uniref:Pentatricopeptide repeat protein n=1 Tax=Fusarium zealandicum TaxID=1053134 RepID=A0A8H4UJZ5_9HYPO|nr:hypothetical protein FZEAL_5314 [Fusarium zealandicum]
MASPNPAPSRAAINALRGVLLTTSCSVIILAEERRRRLNVARAAIENAKKLHTARVHHNSAALAESYGRREAFPIELAHDFSPVSAPNNPIRRRRRRTEPSAREFPEPKDFESIDAFETTLSDQTHPSATPQARPRRWDEWDAARKELSRISDTSPFAHNSLFLKISRDDSPPSPTISKQQSKTRTPETNTTEQSSTPEAIHQSESRHNIPAKSTRSHSTNQDSKTSELLRAAFLDGDARTTERQPIHEIKVEEPASLSSLDTLLTDLESLEIARSHLVEQQQKCIEILRKLVSSESEEPQAILSRGIRLLQSTADSQEYSNMSLILSVVYPVCADVCLLAVPLMDRLLQNRDTEGVRQMLQEFSQLPDGAAKVPKYRFRNEWVTRLLMHYWRKTKDFGQVKGLYGLLQQAGLFTDGIFPLITQYTIRRRIALISLDAGDDATASEEMLHLQQLRPKAVDVDVKLRGRFVVRDAELHQWDQVWAQLNAFRFKAKHAVQFQNVLSWLARIYCQDHSPAEIDIFVRDLVKHHQMTLNKTLAFLVMDKHGRSRDLQALVAWLQFCQDGGLEMDQIFFNEIADKCCRYWNMGRTDVVHMLKGVQSSMPWLHDPLLASYSTNGALHDLHKHLPGEREDRYGIVSALPDSRGDSISVFERTAFRYMNTLALQNNWGRVSDAYQEAADKGLGFSSRCLRLAIVANIRLEGPHSCAASSLISKAHTDGHDISGALVPMLVARLEAGDNVGDVLQEALRKGQRIHDSVYNKAARILNQKGQRDAAIRVCEIAAQQNGMGELAYSKFNFASLVYSYTGQRRYEDLESLIGCFASKTEWWQGSKECKESIKLAMKTIAGRATRDPAPDLAHEEALMCLDGALQHIKTLRATTKQEREALTKEVVGVFKMEQPPAFESGFSPDAQAERPAPKSKKSIVWDATNRPDAAPQPADKVTQRVREDQIARGKNPKDSRAEHRETGRRARTPSPDMSEQEQMFMERQSLAEALF